MLATPQRNLPSQPTKATNVRIAILQHSKDTPPGTLIDWIESRRHPYTVHHLYEGQPLPTLSEFDWLVVLGGAMNVDETEKHPWLVEEKRLIRTALDERKTCLGLCLGGQLLAQCMGAQVKKNTLMEVGWHPIQLGTHLDSDQRLMVFQWHEDAFDLPEGAIRVATNRTTENQGFFFGDHAVGLQFHPEASEEWVRACSEEQPYPTGSHVQSPELLIEGLVFLTPMKKWFFDLLSRMESMTSARLKGKAKG